MKKKKMWKGILFVLPSFVGVTLFYGIPFLMSLGYCFGEQNQPGVITLRHFRELFQNAGFWLATRNTIHIVGVALPMLCVLSLVGALVLEKYLQGYRWIQGVLLIPLALPAASLVLVWQDLLALDGLLNSVLRSTIDWLNSGWSTYVIIGVILWKNTGYNVLLILSTLLTMPKEYVEAAQLEGASGWRIAWSIKIPYLRPLLYFIAVISLQNCFKIFREIYLLQGDYPYEKLYLLQHFMNNNFTKLDIETLSVAAFCIYTVIFVLIYGMMHGQEHCLKRLEA